MTYFKDIQDGIRTTLKGLSLTWRHLRQATHRRTPEGIASDNYFDQQNGLVTLQYPHEQLPIPDNGRYRLRNEIEDCIVCDKCAKICPVDCITIDAIKAIIQIQTAIVHHMTPAVPPLKRPNQGASSVHSHVDCKMVTKLTIPMNLKLRCES